MKGQEFIKRVKKIAKRNGIEVVIDTRQGKGSHITLYYGTKRTTVKDRKAELQKGLLHAMIKQLGLNKEDIL